MAFHPNENQLNVNQLKGPLIGVVIDNKDPLQLRRVRVKIEGVMEGNKPEGSPWFRPKTSGAGSRSDYGNFDAIPQVNSTVMIELPTGDLRNGVYSAMPDTSVDASQNRMYGEDYPDTHGSCDATGTFTRTNKHQGYDEKMHASGLYHKIDKHGNLHVYIPKNLVVHIAGGVALKVDKDFLVGVLGMFGVAAKGDAGISAGGTMEILSGGAATIEAEGNIVDINTGTKFGTKDATEAGVDAAIPEVDKRQKEVKELQKATLVSGEVARDSLKAHSDALQGTRT